MYLPNQDLWIMIRWISKLCPKRVDAKCPNWLHSDSLATLNEMHVFASSFPQTTDTPAAVIAPRLSSLVNSLKLLPLRTPPRKDSIGYIPLIENPLFTLCVFYLPKGSCLPYHNHPSQYVGLRVLKGELEIFSCDAEKTEHPKRLSITQSNVVRRTADSGVFVVEPAMNNIHKVSAVQDSFFLDFVVPPYSSDRTSEGYITYYKLADEKTLISVTEREIDLNMDFCDVNTLLDRKS